MTIEQLQKEMIASMKAGNKLRKNAISEIISTAKNIAIEAKHKDNITEDIVTKAILKTQKIYKEQVETCPTERVELLNEYKESLSYINEFAPKMMTREETEKAIYHIIANFDCAGGGKGALMKLVMPHLKGKADGKIIGEIVDSILVKTGGV